MEEVEHEMLILYSVVNSRHAYEGLFGKDTPPCPSQRHFLIH